MNPHEQHEKQRKEISLFTRRSKLEIIISILKVLNDNPPNCLSTYITYGANLSGQIGKRYLFELESLSLIKIEWYKHRKYYSLTNKGTETLLVFNNLVSILTGIPKINNTRTYMFHGETE